MKRTSSPASTGILIAWSVAAIIFFVGTIIGLFLVTSEAQGITLLRGEHQSLQNDVVIADTGRAIFDKYKDKIDIITHTFPDEGSMPEFVQQFEGILKSNSDSYTFKLNSLNPIPESDRLVLLFSVGLKTDTKRFFTLLKEVTQLPYITRITTAGAKIPEGQNKSGEYFFGVKIYVKNPFSI
jgi:hypothetical protein